MKLYKKETCVENGVKIQKNYLLGKLIFKKEKSLFFKQILFFGKRIIRKNIQPQITYNSINLSDCFQGKKAILKTSVDIIIPINNDSENIDQCFTSILNNTDLTYRVFAINTHSPDKEINSKLDRWKQIFGDKMILLHNDTDSGLVRSINKCFMLTKSHCVILGTKMIVPPSWASRLMYPILQDSTIASVTPFSNSSTMFSLPKLIEGELSDEKCLRIDRILSRLNIPYDQINFNSISGLCIGFNKIAIDKIGGFDKIFEIDSVARHDWCQRALNKGFKHTIAGDLFIWSRQNNNSIAKDQLELCKQNKRMLRKRYPKLFKNINTSSKDNSLRSLKFLAELLYHNKFNHQTIVWFDHSWKGGTELYTFNQFPELQKNNLLLRIQDFDNNTFILTYYIKNQNNSIILKNVEELKTLLQHLHISSIVINNLASYPNPLEMLDLIQNLKKIKGSHISLRLHDFQCVCPSITMVNAQNQHCFVDHLDKCIECFSQIKHQTPIKCASIINWQESWKAAIDNIVDECLVFSHSSYHIITKLYPTLLNKTQIIPHKIKPLRPVIVPPHKKINIGVLGAIGAHKGSLILKEMDDLLSSYSNINIKVIGYVIDNKFKNIKSTGKYNQHELPEIIESECIDIIFIPSIWPETFSYTTSEAMSMEIALASFNVGAPAERIATYKKGLVISHINAQCALDEIIAFMNNHKSI